MSGTVEGGKEAARKNKLNDKDFYRKIGALGGKKSRTGGFASKVIGKDGLTGPQRASIHGAIGGSRSRRNGNVYLPRAGSYAEQLAREG